MLPLNTFEDRNSVEGTRGPSYRPVPATIVRGKFTSLCGWVSRELEQQVIASCYEVLVWGRRLRSYQISKAVDNGGELWHVPAAGTGITQVMKTTTAIPLSLLISATFSAP